MPSSIGLDVLRGSNLDKSVSEYIDHLLDVLKPFGDVRARRMFGGHGIFREGLMFALVADEVVYLKADAKSKSHFVDAGLSQFQYQKAGKIVAMSYYQAPEGFLEDRELALVWSRRAFEAALRARK